MKQFLLIFRGDYSAISKTTSKEMEERNERWMNWIDSIAAKHKLAEGGNHLKTSGKVLKPNGEIFDGPFTEVKQTMMGYIIVKSSSYDEAIKLAKACPILAGKDTSLEIREIASL